MKQLIMFLTLATVSLGCNGQEVNKDSPQTKVETVHQNEPKGTWTVEKEFDAQGNLIRYDSIYSWSSHNDSDSAMSSLRSRVYSNFSSSAGPILDPFFAQDSLLGHPFFNDEFFRRDETDELWNIDRIIEQIQQRHRQLFDAYGPQPKAKEDDRMKKSSF
ncbi:MAG: hypothetical protein HKM28_04865 [Flavobacteriaceae bacterium]|nr:hypothetical protein [Flavobacteriaceae bacterium]